jgi:hypothetical protein
LGSSICVPVFLDELQALPQELSLERFSFYHAGLNPVTDALMTFERTGILGCFSFESRQRAFYSALQRFTKTPFGLVLTAESRADGASRRISIGHSDLYRATAILCTSHMEAAGMRPGYGYLGEWASQDKRFPDKLQEEGFWNRFGE